MLLKPRFSFFIEDQIACGTERSDRRQEARVTILLTPAQVR